MTRFLPGFAALFLLPLPLLAPPGAAAYTILPNLYAQTYCQYRRLGVSSPDAVRAATRAASIEGDNWTWVTFRGTPTRSDIIDTAIVLSRLCPEFADK